MNRIRIAETLDWLRQVRRTKARKFNMRHWAEFTPKEIVKAFWGHETGWRQSMALNHCGTSGCMLGWAASDPIAIKQGLHLEVSYGGNCSVYYGPNHNDEAGMRYFGITGEMGDWLFSPSSYPAGAQRGAKGLDEAISRLEFLLHATPDMLRTQFNNYWADSPYEYDYDGVMGRRLSI